MRVTATAEFMLEPILEPNKDAGSSRDAIGLGQAAGKGLNTRHGTILTLEDISVSFDGFKALNDLNLYIGVELAALHQWLEHRQPRQAVCVGVERGIVWPGGRVVCAASGHHQPQRNVADQLHRSRRVGGPWRARHVYRHLA